MNTKLGAIQNWDDLAYWANWSAVRLARQCGVSMSTLKRHFDNHIGKTPKIWLTEQRQYRAVKIIHSRVSVKESASELGYKHPNQFSREFRKFGAIARPAPYPSTCILVNDLICS